MFARTLLNVLSCAALLFTSSGLVSSSALAQCGSPRHQPRIEYARQITPIIDTPGESSKVSSPTLHDLASASSESHRTANQQWAMKRDAARKSAARAAAPAKKWTHDEIAASKYQAALGIWLVGQIDATRRSLEVVFRRYAKTPTADRARANLAKQ